MKWLTTWNETIFIEERLFRVLLFKYEVNPLFILMIGFPNTGGTSCSFSYIDDKADAFRKFKPSGHMYLNLIGQKIYACDIPPFRPSTSHCTFSTVS
jgi:hypothetical protein